MPCPVCGGLIHPIAGKCKHCKSDLRDLRGPRPAAVAPLPALAPVALRGEAPVAPTAAPATSNGHGTSNGHAAATNGRRSGYTPSPSREPIMPAIRPSSSEYTGPQPILPARVTARHGTGTVNPERSALRHWPVVVIILAVIAILAAVALLVWPPAADTAGKRTAPGATGPSPDHMDTNPLPDQPSKHAAEPPAAPPAPAPPSDPGPSNDPWGGHAQATPPAGSTHDPDLDNPFAPSQQLDMATELDALFNGKGSPAAIAVYTAALKHVCTVIERCGTTADACSLADAAPALKLPSCAMATTCLRRIDRLSCTQANPDDPLELFRVVHECAEALTGC
jgi:hypothetical protein